MSSQPAAAGGGYVAYNSYPAAVGSFNLANGYPVGYGYPGSGMESVNGFGFAFRKRVERIDWKRLASIDVDSVARNLDFQVLQDNIINIAFCSLEAELDSRSIDPNYTKLFKLSQLMIEYLLHSQDYLCSKMQEVQQEFIKEKSEHDATKKEGIEKLKGEIVELKKELNQRKKIIAVQQQLLHNGNDAIHKCAFCAKAFVNTSFLQAHISRRHPEYAGNQMSSSVAYNQPTDFIKAPVHSTTEAAPIRHELENELLEIRERLRLTESQLVEERNARNATTQKDQKEKQKLDEDVNKRFESWKEAQLDVQKSWKEAQLDVQKSEIEKVQDMFMKELKEMSSKLQAAEDNLEDLKRKRSHGSMLGSLKDDVDPEEIRRQRKEMAEEMRKEMHNQVVDVETRMRKEMMEHDKLWKKKMRDVKLQDKQKIVQMNGEVERLKEKENRRRLRDEDEKRRLKDEVVQRISKMENSKRSNINDNQASEPPVEKAVVVALQKAEVPSQMDHDTEEDEEEDFDSGEEEEDDDDRNDDYHRMRDAQAAHLKKTLEDEDDEDDDDDFHLMNVKERLQNDDDLKRQCHSDNLQSLELGLEALGIPKGATHLSNDNYLRSTDTLERERNRKHKKKHDQFSAIRKAYEIEVDEKARQQLRQRPRSMPPKGSSILRTPRSNQSTLRSTQSRPNSLPPQKLKHIPKPSPRAGTLPAKLMSTGQSMMTTTQSFTSTGTLSVTGTSAMSDSNDEVDLYRVPAPQKRIATMEPRPRAKTPTGASSSASSSKAAANSNQKQTAKKELAKEGDSGDDTSGWDDELSNVEPVPQARTKHQTLNSKPAGSVVTQRKLEIERQLSMRDGKKPVGGYDVTPMKSVQSRQNTKKNTFDEPDDIDVLSLTSVSAADDLRPTPKPRNANTRSVTQSTSGPTNSTNTSKWFSSVSSGVSSKSFSAKKDLELNDSWDDDDGDDDE